MAGVTNYGALPLDPRPRTSKGAKTLFVLGHVVLVAAVFYVGRLSFTSNANFDHAEVLDLVVSCEQGKFVGTCETCRDCQDFEYSAGGCSYFKDTFCTLCEPISHCPQDQIRCTDKDDMTCLSCDLGYWDVDCKPCTTCDLPNGYYESQACTQTTDTVCTKATQCEQQEGFGYAEDEEGLFQYMSKQLEYFSDRECSTCTVCPSGTWTEVPCQMGDNDQNLLGLDTVCTPCTECAIDHLVTEACTIMTDTVCTACKLCDDDEYITELCMQGDIFTVGEDTVCTECTQREDDEWELFECGGTSDALYRPCTTCMDGEYMQQACTNTSDTLCPDCEKLKHCPEDKVTCTNDKDAKCERCDDGFDGDRCCYEKTFGACGTATTRERIAFRYGFEGDTNEDFIQFCMQMCEEFPDCLAFEVLDGGENLEESGKNNLVSKESACYFKAAYTFAPVDPTKDCFSNICRQGMPNGLGF